MAEQYSHTLIAKRTDFRPSAAQVQRFLSTMVGEKVVPGMPRVCLRIPTGKTREYPFIDPFTGQKLRVEIKDHKKLNSPEKITWAIQSLRDYEVEVVGVGRPKTPPLVLEFKEPYHLGVTCYAYSEPRSTSDLHEKPSENRKALPYGRPCLEMGEYGYFTNPHTLATIEVPGAACARFWIQFELGKFLFPEIPSGSLDLLNPLIVHEAKNIFETEFLQGCYWG